MERNQPSKSLHAAIGSPVLERNRYFTGKFMTAREFQHEQEYVRSRHHLHNRLLHGWGVLRGLEVQPHPRSECQHEAVLVRAGAALDCYGREVMLLEDTPVEVPRSSPTQELLLCVSFSEEHIEFTPAIYREGATESDGEQANRFREGASLRLLHLSEVNERCWQGGAQHVLRVDDREEQFSEKPALLEPDCPCGDAVPLALLKVSTEHPQEPIQIDSSGRRHLPITADFLTHIVHTNWPHAGRVSLHHLRHNMNGRLEIKFDRKIRPITENRGAGISEYTFQVRFGGVQQDDIRYLPFPYKEPPVLENDHVATFRIEPRYLDPGNRDDLKDKVIYVTLKCDFVIDSRGMPVDGAHLGGTLPTHSGRMGGDFESWFYVED